MSKINIQNLDQFELNKLLADAWLNIRVDDNEIWNPLNEIPSECADHPELWFTYLMSCPEYFSFLCSQILNIELYPTQGLVLKELWAKKFPMLICSRGFSKTFLLAVYSLLRMLLLPGRKIIIGGAVFRQSKLVFEYMETIWNNAPLLRNICGNGREQGPTHGTDVWTFRVGDSVLKAIPIGHSGDKVRGLRANDLYVDEFSSVSREIFETVLSGFLSVKANPIESLKFAAAEKLKRLLNIQLDEAGEKALVDNQLVISGTAYYEHNHFNEYWKRWHAIITSKGDSKILQDVLKGGKLDWRKFAVIRIPVELIPDGFMDAEQIARSKGTMETGTFEMEFGSVFAKDSNGFFKRSLIQAAVASPTNSIQGPDGKTILFGAKVTGDPTKKYVIAIDPAAEVDNFSISVLELWPDHRRLVYAWTTNKEDYKERLAAKLINESDYYSFCIRKIRDLMRVFPCELIAIDSQGGGTALSEAFHDRDKLRPGELPIWPIIGDKPADTDGEMGLHIIKLINFADANWTSAANHTLKKDIADKTLLFPHNDAIDIAIDNIEDTSIYDTLEDCIYEIEETKNELCTIIITHTTTGRDRWDTPDTKVPGSKKGRLVKDRYSSLLIGNMEARELQKVPPPIEYGFSMGWAAPSKPDDELSGRLFTGPDWASQTLQNLYD